MLCAKPRTPIHGGALEGLAQRYALHAADLIDFSANINPFGPPPAVLALLADRDAVTRSLAAYPDRDASSLKSAISERYTVPRAAIAVGNGGGALFDSMLRSIAPTRCLVPIPAFSEYRRAIEACGHGWETFALESREDFRLDPRRTIAEIERNSPGVLILTNPHNPSGALAPRDALLDIVHAASAMHCTVLLDEAFIDYAPGESLLADAATMEHLVVFRSVTKFYAMPAMRVAYAVAAPPLAERIEAFLPSWSTSTLAIEAAARAIGDRLFDEQNIRCNAMLRDEVARHLGDIGVRVLPSAANYVFLELPASWGTRELICEKLVRSWGMVVRDCGDYDGLADRSFVRVAVKDRSSNERLIQAFRSLSHEK